MPLHFVQRTSLLAAAPALIFGCIDRIAWWHLRLVHHHRKRGDNDVHRSQDVGVIRAVRPVVDAGGEASARELREL